MMKFMDQAKIAAKAYVASRFMPIQWAERAKIFEDGAEWAQRQFALQLLTDMKKMEDKLNVRRKSAVSVEQKIGDQEDAMLRT